jgi:hypothetical protein
MAKDKYTRHDMDTITLHGKFAQNIISIINQQVIGDTGPFLKPGTEVIITVIQ